VCEKGHSTDVACLVWGTERSPHAGDCSRTESQMCSDHTRMSGG
jgi:hypothetical protein